MHNTSEQRFWDSAKLRQNGWEQRSEDERRRQSPASPDIWAALKIARLELWRYELYSWKTPHPLHRGAQHKRTEAGVWPICVFTTAAQRTYVMDINDNWMVSSDQREKKNVLKLPSLSSVVSLGLSVKRLFALYTCFCFLPKPAAMTWGNVTASTVHKKMKILQLFF